MLLHQQKRFENRVRVFLEQIFVRRFEKLAQGVKNFKFTASDALCINRFCLFMHPGIDQVMLGQALFYLENFDEAQAAFAAAQSDRRSRQLAAQWISYIESEKDRIAQLAAALE